MNKQFLQYSDTVTLVAASVIAPGMSGSPIVSAEGHAVGVINTDTSQNPALVAFLPGWMLGPAERLLKQDERIQACRGLWKGGDGLR